MGKTLSALAIILSFLIVPGPVQADCENLRGERVRWLVPSRPGGGYDAYSRLIQPFLEQALDATVIIENRPEAGGLVAAMRLSEALPDGKTFGLINGPGLLTASMLGLESAPEPGIDLTPLARVTNSQMYLLVSGDSAFKDLQDLGDASVQKPLVAGVRDVGSASFFALPVVARNLGLDYQVVTGYVGSSSRIMALLRGEVDFILQSHSSVHRFMASGELRPLLQISGEPRAFNNLQIAQMEESTGLNAIFSAGRLVMAPPDLPPQLESCLQRRFSSILHGKAFLQSAEKAGLPIQTASPEQIRVDLQSAREQLREYVPLVRAAIARSRD